MSLLLRASWRWLRHHPWQSASTLLGIALAVAVVTGVDLANESARRAFSASVDGVAGKATHEIVGGPRGVEETLYRDLRRQGFRPSAPVVEGWVQAADRPLLLLGIDPLAEGELRSFSASWQQEGADIQSTGVPFGDFMVQPGAVVMGRELAADLGLAVGQSFQVSVAGKDHQLTLLALLRPSRDLDRQSARDLLLCDISTAQEILAQRGWLSRIDLRLADDSRLDEAAWRRALPPGVVLQSKSSRSGVLDQMTSAFRLNLQALSLLALLVGMFLIYNTMTFAVVERRPLLGNLRILGVTRRQIFWLVLGEALTLGLLASLVGLALGYVIAQGLLILVTRTINDLYFVLSVGKVQLLPIALAKGFLLGTLGSVAASLVPAREAMATPPRQIMQRSSLERRVRRTLPQRTSIGLAGLLGSGLLLQIPSTSLGLGFGILLLFVLSCAVLVPSSMWLLMRLLQRLGRGLGLLARLAIRGVNASLSRTGVATAALVVAVAMTLGVALMVGSFRSTLEIWLETTLEADVYVAPVDFASRGGRQDLDPAVVQRLLQTPGVAAVTTTRRVEVASRQGPLQLMALGMERQAFNRFTFVDGTAEEIWPHFVAGGALISEPLAYHRRLAVGDSLELLSADGWRPLRVAGVYYDYGSDRGVVSLYREAYDRWWRDAGIHTLAFYAEAPQTPSAGASQPLIDALRQRAAGEPLLITANGDLRRYSLDVFDRTFAITQVLRLLAMGVAFLGILSALMALQLERRRELAVLRAQGMTPRQLASQVILQTSLMGAVAGLLSIPLGIALSVLLIDVINRRAFGWSLDLELDAKAMLASFVLALAAALMAGLYPAWRLGRSTTASALREE